MPQAKIQGPLERPPDDHSRDDRPPTPETTSAIGLAVDGSTTAHMNSPRREVARALLFDDGHRILLIHWRDPDTGREFFEPPGGHRERGESYEDALRREIAEETGILDLEIGHVLAEIDHSFTFAGVRYDCSERFFVCQLAGTRRTQPSLDDVESQGILGTRWFSGPDLAARSPDDFEPPELLAMIHRLGRQDPS